MTDLGNSLEGFGRLEVLYWYDFVCPFCYVGQHRTAILVQSGLQVVELPFQIHPEIPRGGVEAGPRTGPMYAMLEREAEAAGLPLHWPPRLPNTRRALSVAEWARRREPVVFPQLQRRLFAAHFALGEDLGDPAVVDGQAKASGVDIAHLHAALSDGGAEAAVAEAELVARQYGVQATPAWLLPQGLVLGLQPAAAFEQLAIDACAVAGRPGPSA